MPPKATDAPEQKALRDIEKYGWHIVHVAPEGDSPGWSFTIGLHHGFGHPELVVFGVPHQAAHDILNVAGEAIKGGKTYEVGPAYLDFLEGYAIEFRPVQERWFAPFLGLAVWYYQGVGFPVRQMFWPSRDHHMPWDAEASDSLRDSQPLLYEDDPAAARAEALLATLEDD